MADGTVKPIEDVTIGDSVVSTDPGTGKTTTQHVSLLHINHDRDLVDVKVTVVSPAVAGSKVKVGVGKGAGTVRGPTTVTLHTTQHHPFWDQTDHQWADAKDLKAGHRLHTSDGTVVTVAAVTTVTGTKLTRDLTITDIHTYYVVAGTTPVLVHNCGPETFHHGTDVDSAVGLLNGSPLDAAAAAAKHTDGPGGFFMATHADDAAFFATRNGPGAVLDVTLSGRAMTALREAGATIRSIPSGPRSPNFAGQEFHIPTSAFDLFNDLRTAGEITFGPG